MVLAFWGLGVSGYLWLDFRVWRFWVCFTVRDLGLCPRPQTSFRELDPAWSILLASLGVWCSSLGAHVS